MRISLQAAYILHSRPYRNTSKLLDIFSREQGRAVLVARGARKATSRLQGQLQPFLPLLLSWQGRGEVQTLTGAEPATSVTPAPLQGRVLLSGFYLNELLLRLLARHDPHPELYDAYAHTLHGLARRPLSGAQEQALLRGFECFLLQELGYGLLLTQDREGQPVQAGSHYCYRPDRGPEKIRPGQDCEQGLPLRGVTLLALHQGRLAEQDEAVLREARQLLRMNLAPHLGGKPLKSRELYLQQKQLLESAHD